MKLIKLVSVLSVFAMFSCSSAPAFANQTSLMCIKATEGDLDSTRVQLIKDLLPVAKNSKEVAKIKNMSEKETVVASYNLYCEDLTPRQAYVWVWGE